MASLETSPPSVPRLLIDVDTGEEEEERTRRDGSSTVIQTFIQRNKNLPPPTCRLLIAERLALNCSTERELVWNIGEGGLLMQLLIRRL